MPFFNKSNFFHLQMRPQAIAEQNSEKISEFLWPRGSKTHMEKAF
jgi:hypothetical protein